MIKFEFFVCLITNSTTTLSKVYNVNATDKAIILQFCSWMYYLGIVIMLCESLNIFSECAAICVHLSPMKEKVPLLLEGAENVQVWQRSKVGSVESAK